MFSLFTLYFYAHKKYNVFYVLLLLSFFVHPNNAVILSGIYFISSFVLFKYGYITQKKIFLLLPIIVLFGILSSLFKLNEIEVSSIISNNYWYANMIRDEADDFSLVYQVIHNFKHLIPFLFIYMITFIKYISSNTKKDGLKFTLLLLVFIPAIIFLFLLFLELLSVYTGNMLFISPIISLQPGHKLLGYSFFPLVFLWALFLKDYKIFKINKLLFIILVIISSLVVIFTTIYKGKILEEYTYLERIYDLDDSRTAYSETLVIKNNNLNRNPSFTSIYKVNDGYSIESKQYNLMANVNDNQDRESDLDSDYMNKYDNIAVYNSLIEAIRSRVTTGSGIIIPPYLINMRDSLPDYDMYFQEHHDGNLMMGDKKIASLLLSRMKDLLGIDYTEVPRDTSSYLQRDSTIIYSYLRKFFLEIDTDTLLKISNKYKNYNYFITEASVKLPLYVLYQDDNYIIYRIKD